MTEYGFYTHAYNSCIHVHIITKMRTKFIYMYAFVSKNLINLINLKK